jgi:hypothetical protein
MAEPAATFEAMKSASLLRPGNRYRPHREFSLCCNRKDIRMVIPMMVGLLFFAIGIFIFISGISSVLKRKKQNAAALSTTGVVIAFAREMGRGGYLYYPQVEFRLASGQAVRFQSAVGSSRAGFSVGQQVNVLYAAHNPQEAEIDGLTSMWLLPGCMIGMGILFTVIGFILSAMMILVALSQQ